MDAATSISFLSCFSCRFFRSAINPCNPPHRLWERSRTSLRRYSFIGFHLTLCGFGRSSTSHTAKVPWGTQYSFIASALDIHSDAPSSNSSNSTPPTPTSFVAASSTFCFLFVDDNDDALSFNFQHALYSFGYVLVVRR
eukprot:scaffold4658_cov118-Cylindrotheca_fusiformis.AAC.4